MTRWLTPCLKVEPSFWARPTPLSLAREQTHSTSKLALLVYVHKGSDRALFFHGLFDIVLVACTTSCHVPTLPTAEQHAVSCDEQFPN